MEFNQNCYITSPRDKVVRKQSYFSMSPSSCPAHYLLLNHWVEFNQTCYITSPHGKGVREQHYFSVRPSSIHLSVTLSPKSLVRIQPNLLHHFPSWLGCAKATLFFHPSIHPTFVHLSIRLLLNPWAEFNQTCYMTSPHGKGVGEQVCPSVIL